MSWEPTKVVCKCGSSLISRWTSEINEWQNLHKVCLNTVSPIKEWVGLTDEQIEDCFEESCRIKVVEPKDGIKGSVNIFDFGRAIEAKLKERNT